MQRLGNLLLRSDLTIVASHVFNTDLTWSPLSEQHDPRARLCTSLPLLSPETETEGVGCGLDGQKLNWWRKLQLRRRAPVAVSELSRVLSGLFYSFLG